MSANENNRNYWRTYEELAQTEAYREAIHREFTETEAGELDEPTRRHFLAIMGASLAMTSLAGCLRRPEERIMPYSQAPEDVLPGMAQYYATSGEFGGRVGGYLVASHEGRPTKLEGNPDHPASLGGTTAAQQGLVLGLYDPSRPQKPILQGQEADWTKADDFIRKHFAAIRQAGQGIKVAVLAEASSSPTQAALRDEFLNTFAGAKWFTYEPISDDNQRAGLKAALGAPLRPQPRFNKAKVVVSFDADFLGTDGDVVANAHLFAKNRRIQKPGDQMSRLYVIEGRHSLTGSNADHRLRVKSPRVQTIAFGLVTELIKRGTPINQGLHNAALEHGRGLSDAEQRFVSAIADDVLTRKDIQGVDRDPLFVAGRRQPPVVHAIVAGLNAGLGCHGTTIYYFQDPTRREDALGDYAGLSALADALRKGEIETLVVLGANPIYSAPGDLAFAEAFGRAKTTICLSDYVDETAKLATWALPRAHFLESWGDHVHTDGTASVQQPIIAPLHGAWSELELLARVLGREAIDGHSLVRGFWKQKVGATGFHARWRKWLNDGIIDEPLFGTYPTFKMPEGLGDLAVAQPAADGLVLSFVEDAKLFDGRFGNNSWLQEAPDPMTKITWDNAALVSPATARELGVEAEDRLRLIVGERVVELPAWIMPGQADGEIVLSLGYGRSFDNFLPYHEKGRVGFDVNPLRLMASPHLTVGAKAEKGDGKYLLACVQRYVKQEPGFDFPARDLVREATVAEYEKNPRFAKPGIIEHHEVPEALVVHPPERSLFGDYDYSQGYQWGLVIDLNTCTGCNACVVACAAENTIPAVGKDQVRRGREMHWIRMDRYFVGNEEAPEVVHQPVSCMHCETAPCENVCPVAATVHSPEGLNDMAYNRCIGTRYCSNNCPFKVRRFNFYNYNKDQPELVWMQRNPNVTVRFRGVIEKCSYCVQRINAGKRRAKAAPTGEAAKAEIAAITPACAQACPSGAIVFGDINNPQSEVAKLKLQDRDYKMLSELNLKTRTSYLAKVRNPNPKLVG